MTNWTYARNVTEEERAKGMHCFVQHADAGGRCEEPASKVVYGLNFCEAHGTEVEAGARLQRNAFDDAAYHAALMHAYSSEALPELVRESLDNWTRDESPRTIETALLDALATTHKLMRLAYEDGETPLLETLEEEREGLAAHAAYAMRELSPSS